MFDTMLRTTWFAQPVLREILTKYLRRLTRVLGRKIQPQQSFTKIFFDVLRVEDDKLKIIDEIVKFVGQSIEGFPIRVGIQDLIEICEANHKIANFDAVYSNYDAKESVLQTNWIDPV